MSVFSQMKLHIVVAVLAALLLSAAVCQAHTLVATMVVDGDDGAWTSDNSPSCLRTDEVWPLPTSNKYAALATVNQAGVSTYPIRNAWVANRFTMGLTTGDAEDASTALYRRTKIWVKCVNIQSSGVWGIWIYPNSDSWQYYWNMGSVSGDLSPGTWYGVDLPNSDNFGWSQDDINALTVEVWGNHEAETPYGTFAIDCIKLYFEND